MATINDVTFVVAWTSTYPTVLDDPGRLTTRTGYTNFFVGGELGLPWEAVDAPPSWSRFWSSYMGKPGKLRSLTADAAWERVVPFQLRDHRQLDGPGGATARVRVLVHPASISVVITVRVQGHWPIPELADAMCAIAASPAWQDAAAPGVDRTLRGIATDLRDAAVRHVAGPDNELPEPDADRRYTICVPTDGEGNPTDLDTNSPEVASCLAGLAGLGPAVAPNAVDHTRFSTTNSDPNLASRTYRVNGGHAIWHPGRILEQPGNALLCLIRNHADLAVHIAALHDIVWWAAERIRCGEEVGAAVQSLVLRAAERLRILHEGIRRITYQSGMARDLAATTLADADAVLAAL